MIKDINKFKPDIYVVKWVDYTAKYGFGYYLSNETTGVNFNDGSRLIMDKDFRHITYYEPYQYAEDHKPGFEEIRCFTLAWPPEDLKDKVLLLQHFWSYLDGNEHHRQLLRKALHGLDKKEEIGIKKKHDHNGQVYLKKWNQTKHANIFHLTSNSTKKEFGKPATDVCKIIQTCFSDGSIIILGGNSEEFGKDMVTYVDTKGKKKNYALSSAMDIVVEYAPLDIEPGKKTPKERQ